MNMSKVAVRTSRGIAECTLLAALVERSAVRAGGDQRRGGCCRAVVMRFAGRRRRRHRALGTRACAARARGTHVSSATLLELQQIYYNYFVKYIEEFVGKMQTKLWQYSI